MRYTNINCVRCKMTIGVCLRREQPCPCTKDVICNICQRNTRKALTNLIEESEKLGLYDSNRIYS